MVLARGPFEETDKVRRGHDGRHAVAGKFHRVLRLRRDGQFADGADFGT